MSKAAMKLALDALEGCYGRTKRYGVNRARAIVSLSQALAEPEQPARVPLTDAQIECITSDNSLDTIHAVVRAVEAAHGIKPLCFGPYDPEDDQR